MITQKKGLSVWIRTKSTSTNNCNRPMDYDLLSYTCRGSKTCSDATDGTCTGTDGCEASDEWATKGLGVHSYCRNPLEEQNTIWCYTTDSATRFETCAPLTKCESYWWKSNQCKLFSSKYNPASLPASNSASSNIHLWLNKDNYDKLNYLLPTYTLEPSSVSDTITYQIVTSTSSLNSITASTDFEAPV